MEKLEGFEFIRPDKPSKCKWALGKNQENPHLSRPL
jgi:hypothetical protein